MKRFILLLVVIFIQTINAQDIYIGAKVGLNLSNYVGEDAMQDLRIGYHGGVSVEFNFSDVMGAQIEGLYSTQGAENNNFLLKADYISLPFFVKIYPTEKFSIDLGAQVSYLINEGVFSKDNQGSLPIIIIDEKKPIDTAFLAGLSYKIEKDYYIQARYTIGISEVDINGEWKNQVFQLSFGYQFL